MLKAKGFTLVELLVVITIIGIVSALSIAIYEEYKVRAEIAVAVHDLKRFEAAFTAYLIDNDDFPNDTHIVLPSGMEDYIPSANWGETPLGGTYNWEGPDNYAYAGIAFFTPTAPTSSFQTLDTMIDDGNLLTGKFRVGSNGRYVYIIDE